MSSGFRPGQYPSSCADWPGRLLIALASLKLTFNSDRFDSRFNLASGTVLLPAHDYQAYFCLSLFSRCCVHHARGIYIGMLS